MAPKKEIVKDKVTTKNDDFIALILFFAMAFACAYFYFAFVASDDEEGLWWKILSALLFVIIGSKFPAFIHRCLHFTGRDEP